MKLAIILVNFNLAQELLGTISQLLEQSQKEDFQIIIVDNGEFEEEIADFEALRKPGSPRIDLKEILSQGGVLAELEQKGSRFNFIKNENNLGFGFAHNQALEKLTSNVKYALFLNPDCRITEKNLKKLIQTANQVEAIGAVAPKILKQDGTLQKWTGKQQKKGKKKLPADTAAMDWVTGACLLVKVQAFKKVKGFDPKLFLYFEDKDFCRRLNQTGYLVLRANQAVAIHKESKSRVAWKVRKKAYYQAQNYYVKKHYGWLAQKIMKILRFPIYLKNVYF